MGRKGKKRSYSKNYTSEGTSRDIVQPEWVIDINESLKKGFKHDLGGSWTIYKVPSNMREVNRKAYVPKLISIGPFHRGDPRLQSMEKHKMRYLLRLLGNNGLSIDTLVDAMKELEINARGCYSEVFDYTDSDEFVQMMVVDGCFIIELLRFYYKFDKEETVEDPIFATRWMLRSLQRDLLMLENQLPFFVLKKLFELTSKKQEPSLFELVYTFFDPLLPRDYDKKKLKTFENFDHMLDAFRSTFLSSIENNVRSWKQLKSSVNIPLVQERQLIHCTTELKDIGLQFKMKNNTDLLDISFRKGKLEVPPLYIDDNTVPLFLNFLAYEQCDEDAKPFFTNYFMFFDSLINNPKDVEILHHYGIVNHVLGSEKDVANLFNKICREIVYDLEECYLSKQMKDINNYCKDYYANTWRVWWTDLRVEYFSSPWAFISLLAGILLLLLTITQTYYAANEAHKD